MKKFLFALCFVLCTGVGHAQLGTPASNIPTVMARGQQQQQPQHVQRNNVDLSGVMTPFQFNMMEPFMNNTMRERLAPPNLGNSPSPQQVMMQQAPMASITPVSAFALPQMGEGKSERRVGQRPAPGGNVSQARAANTPGGMLNAPAGAPTQHPAQLQGNQRPPGAGHPGARRSPATDNNPNIARAAAIQPAVQPSRPIGSRGSPSTGVNTARAAATTGIQHGVTARRPAVGNQTPPVAVQQAGQMTGDITPAQCMANYSACMDNYCRRPNTPFDRCFCSARLAQIDAEHRPVIDNMVRRIVMHQSGGIMDGMTQDEINEFWNDTFAAGVGTNNMANLDEALRVDWSTTESQRRGQTAFVAGDNFCHGHLRGCFAVADQMRNMYRTKIGQDCRAYETGLRRKRHALEIQLRQFEPKSTQ